MRYGMPYKGSKNSIAEKIINALPEAENFYDLFGGGGAISHCAILSGKYNHVYYNEIDPLVYKGFSMAINGEFKDEKRWISREDFFQLKDTDPYAAICFSFGNDLKTYAYSPEKEKIKSVVHKMLVADTIQERRLEWKKVVDMIFGLCTLDQRTLKDSEPLERLLNLERLQSLQSLQSQKRLILSNKSYEQVMIESNSIIYCDIPYKGTNKYIFEFDYNKFYSWAKAQNEKVYISEYDMPKEFDICYEWDKRVTLATGNRAKSCERLYCNKSGGDVKQWVQAALI